MSPSFCFTFSSVLWEQKYLCTLWKGCDQECFSSAITCMNWHIFLCETRMWSWWCLQPNVLGFFFWGGGEWRGKSWIILGPLEVIASQLNKVAQGLSSKILKISKDGASIAFVRQPTVSPLLQPVYDASCNITVCLWLPLLCNSLEGDWG